MIKWTIEKFKKLISIAREIRRPMTFYVLVSFAAFYGIFFHMIPKDPFTMAGGGVGFLCLLIGANGYYVYLWGKAKLEAEKREE